MKSNNDLRVGQETWRELENIHRFWYSYATIFSDFVDACLLSLLSLTDNLQHQDVIERLKQNKMTGTYEDRYLELVGRYKENKTERRGKRPIDYIAHAFGLLQKETWESGQDVLRNLYGKSQLWRAWTVLYADRDNRHDRPDGVFRKNLWRDSQ